MVKELSTIRIEELDLSIRTRNCMLKHGEEVLLDLLPYDECSLYKIPQMGAKSIKELLEVIYRIKKLTLLDQVTPDVDFEIWSLTPNGEKAIYSYIVTNDISIKSMDLTTKEFNALKYSGIQTMAQIYKNKDIIPILPGCPETGRVEILEKLKMHIQAIRPSLIMIHSKKEATEEKQSAVQTTVEQVDTILEEKTIEVPKTLEEMLLYPEYAQRVYHFVESNDWDLSLLSFTERYGLSLENAGYSKFSQVLFLENKILLRIPGIGPNCINELEEYREAYLEKYNDLIMAYASKEYEKLFTIDYIKELVLKLYMGENSYSGFSFATIKRRIPKRITNEQLADALYELINNCFLEFVDYKLYRVFPSLYEYLMLLESPTKEDSYIIDRLNGKTLIEIGTEQNITRERVRQIVDKRLKKIKREMFFKYQTTQIFEDQYAYLFQNYLFDFDVAEHLDVEFFEYNYLKMEYSKGTKSLEEALLDEKLTLLTRYSIQGYLDREKLLLGNARIEKNRQSVENYLLKTYCKTTTTIDEYIKIYKEFITKNDLDSIPSLTKYEEYKSTCQNKFPEHPYILYSHKGKFRYYNTTSYDFNELFDVLGLDVYDGIEISTLKFFHDYPELMCRYDIQDHYELYNLLKYEYNSEKGVSFDRTPIIKFGTTDRKSQIMNLLEANAPIKVQDFIALCMETYGFEMGAIPLLALNKYNSRGVLDLGRNNLSEEEKTKLSAKLTENFYFYSQIKSIYMELFPQGNPKRINSYSMKDLGLLAYTNYVVKGYRNAYEYFVHLLTKDKKFDVSIYSKNFKGFSYFNTTLQSLRREFTIIEYAPRCFINISCLEAFDITREDLKVYVEDVYNFIDDDLFFNQKTLTKMGYSSSVYDMGFEDIFYNGLLAYSGRFSSVSFYDSTILYKGNIGNVTKLDFITWLVTKEGGIDIWDLKDLMEEEYGFVIPSIEKLILDVQKTDLYYDRIMDKVYVDKEDLYEEFD